METFLTNEHSSNDQVIPQQNTIIIWNIGANSKMACMSYFIVGLDVIQPHKFLGIANLWNKQQKENLA